MGQEFESIFFSLRKIVQKHAGSFSVAEDKPGRYCLEGAIGPATLKAWGGKVKRKTIPVVWVEVGKAYVSYHLMGVYGSLLEKTISKKLQSRKQGKTCFNFKNHDDVLFTELDELTRQALAAFKNAGFVADQK